MIPLDKIGRALLEGLKTAGTGFNEQVLAKTYGPDFRQRRADFDLRRRATEQEMSLLPQKYDIEKMKAETAARNAGTAADKGFFIPTPGQIGPDGLPVLTPGERTPLNFVPAVTSIGRGAASDASQERRTAGTNASREKSSAANRAASAQRHNENLDFRKHVFNNMPTWQNVTENGVTRRVPVLRGEAIDMAGGAMGSGAPVTSGPAEGNPHASAVAAFTGAGGGAPAPTPTPTPAPASRTPPAARAGLPQALPKPSMGVRENVARMTTHLQLYDRLKDHISKYRPTGQVQGRITELLTAYLGGALTTEQERQVSTELKQLFRGEAFFEGGKNLTGHEKELFLQSLPQMKDSTEQALTRVEAGRTQTGNFLRNYLNNSKTDWPSLDDLAFSLVGLSKGQGQPASQGQPAAGRALSPAAQKLRDRWLSEGLTPQ